MYNRWNCSKEEYISLNRNPFEIYRKKVKQITKKQPLHTLENYHKRSLDGYHLDHIISIKYGFLNNIEPDIIGDIRNLRFIPAKSNLHKSDFFEKESFDMLMYFIEQGNKCHYNGI